MFTTTAMPSLAISVAFFATKVGAGVARALRKDVFEKVESFSNEEFNHFSTASLITRTTNRYYSKYKW